MLLAININNTQIKIGGYRGTELLFHWRIATDRDRTDDEYAMILRELFRHIELQFAQVESVAISCVVPPLRYLRPSQPAILRRLPAHRRARCAHRDAHSLREP